VSHPIRALPENHLLAVLPAADQRRLLAHREPVELSLSDTLSEPGERTQYVLFPIDSVISLITVIDPRTQLEVGLVGNEGMLGITLVLGMSASPLRALVQSAGRAWRIDAADFSHQLERSPALRRGLNRYVYVLLSQLARTAACTSYHFVEARLARWLLMTRDRVHADQFHVTHEFLAYMLGVRRVGITRAASVLQQRKLIRYRRGELEILDGHGLEATACGCYASLKDTYVRVLG
jgi:CRP-like cAMP-binding protein